MRYKKIVFNGKYLCKESQRGVHRYTHQMLCALDKIIKPGVIEVLVPSTNKKLPVFQNIIVKQYGGKIFSKGWQYTAFQYYILKTHALAVCLSCGAPFFHPGIIAIHDVRYLEDKPEVFELKKIWNHFVINLFAKTNIKRARAIVTVSEFSKQKICDYYHCHKKKISVLYSAWQHVLDIETDNTIFQKKSGFPQKDYYFYLGGIEKNKNLQWILKMAQINQNDFFVLAGPPTYLNESNQKDWSSLKNLKHIGYVSDQEMKALITNAKALLFPSLYEGFGLPPLEAIALGTPVLVSNTTCLPEIYGKDLRLFDPYDYDVNLNDLLEKNKSKYMSVLNRYSWDCSARGLYDLITTL